MPMENNYFEQLKSSCADMKNTGARWGPCFVVGLLCSFICFAMFLQLLWSFSCFAMFLQLLCSFSCFAMFLHHLCVLMLCVANSVVVEKVGGRAVPHHLSC